MTLEINNETDELNYLFGGYFSGRGYITLAREKKSHYYELRVSITMEDEETMKLFQQNFGGGDQLRKEPKDFRRFKSTFRRNKRLFLRNNLAMDFLFAVEPYIISKRLRKKIKLAKKYWYYKEKNFKKRSPQIRATKHKYYLQMKGLK